MTILDLTRQYVATVNASRSYTSSLTRTARRAASYGIETTCQLSDKSVCKFLDCLQAEQYSDTTVHNMRRELLTLWRYAYLRNLTDRQPGRVRRVAARFAPPEAWGKNELRRMYERAREDITPVSITSKFAVKDVMPGWLMLGYETAARFTDVYEADQQDFRRECFVKRAAKTGKVMVWQLSAKCLREVEGLLSRSPDGTLFKHCLTRRRAFKMWRGFLDRHNFRGTSRWLRRSAATALEAEEPNAASVLLQHSNPQLVRRHYLDASLLAPAHRPPKFVG